LPNRKVILGILYKFFWLKLFRLIECGCLGLADIKEKRGWVEALQLLKGNV
jgi:hypothetical protein